jgi:hypothetical protein
MNFADNGLHLAQRFLGAIYKFDRCTFAIELQHMA